MPRHTDDQQKVILNDPEAVEALLNRMKAFLGSRSVFMSRCTIFLFGMSMKPKQRTNSWKLCTLPR
jgi:hypothetical protein